MSLLITLVGASQRVGANSARSTKIRELASYLKTLAADEIGIAVHYLSGEIPQGGSASAIRHYVRRPRARRQKQEPSHSPSWITP